MAEFMLFKHCIRVIMGECTKKRVKFIFTFLLIWSCVGFIILSGIPINTSNVIIVTSQNDEGILNLSTPSDYFHTMKDLISDHYLVNDDKCKIPDIDPWNHLISPYIADVKPDECKNTVIRLTLVKHSTVILNEDVLHSKGLNFNQIHCCYHTIERVENISSDAKEKIDNLIRLSQECFEMGRITVPKSGLIKVICKSRLASQNFSYENLHLVPFISNDENREKKLLSFWENCLDKNKDHYIRSDSCQQVIDQGTPPNILILGLDSVSRLNFRRTMKSTISVLENVVEAHEMKGYNKVGDNTFPNMVPLMASLSEDELHSICHPTRWTHQDECPYIWKEFSKQGYLTGHLEDSPRMAMFNSMRTGFIKQPVDIYPRPLMIAAYNNNNSEMLRLSVDCIGYQRPEEIILEYMVGLVELANSRKIPYFITSWLTDLSHDDLNKLKNMDDLMARIFRTMFEKGLLENTVLVLMSDHGHRFLDVRASSSGWYEDKLPVLWMKLPSSITKTRPQWEDALRYNSRKLVTTFNLHETLKEILTAYAVFQDSSEFSKELKLAEAYATKHWKRGISLLGKLPSRTCHEAGVPKGFCACYVPSEYSSNLALIKEAGETMVKYINTVLPAPCIPLKLSTIITSGVLACSKTSGQHCTDSLIIGLIANPGNFRFEGWVSYNHSTSTFSDVSHVLRINKIKTSQCLTGDDRLQETLCYCPDSKSYSY